MTKRDIVMSILAMTMNKAEENNEELLAHSVRENSYPKILPPFGGEMGFEVRSFLGRVEPWLRNGWKIIARRPEFYPKDTVIYAPHYFEREKEILKKYNAVRVINTYDIRRNIQKKGELKLIARIKYLIKEIEYLKLSVKLDREMRELFKEYILDSDRPLTRWDKVLLSTNTPNDIRVRLTYENPILPTYQPIDYLEPSTTWEPHIGVQLRAIDWETKRNSNPERVLGLAQKASQYLQLPILVYGHPDGTTLPDGYVHTADKGVEGLLKRELGYLNQCRLMFAPDSGWADLMAWLKIPTLIEKESASTEFYWFKSWRPRLDVIKKEIDIIPQIDRLLALPECVPEIHLTDERNSKKMAKVKRDFIQFG